MYKINKEFPVEEINSKAKLITIEDIISDGLELDLWCYVLGFRVRLGEKFCNPFRTDNNPNAKLKVYKNRVILFDIAGWTGHNCMSMLFKVKGSSGIQDELRRFYSHYSNNISFARIKYITPAKKKRTDIKYHAVEYTDYTLEYWNNYNIDLAYLKKNQVYPVTHYWYTNSDDLYIKMKIKEERCYAIPCGNDVKLYFVDRKKTDDAPRFISNFECKWYNQIKTDFAIGCTSFKDAAVIACNSKFQTNWLLTGENGIPSNTSDLIDLFVGDNDEAGINFASKMSSYCKVTTVEHYKDVAEILKNKDNVYFKEILNYFSLLKVA